MKNFLLGGRFFGVIVLFLTACQSNQTAENQSTENQTLTVFLGSASKPPMEEIVELFEQKTQIKVDVIIGSSGFVLSQMELTGMGDIFFPGSSDFMEMAKTKNLVYPETEQIPMYLVSAINVVKGNPKKIYGLRDLLRPDLKIAIASPKEVCVGTYAVEIIEKNFSQKEKEQFRANILTYSESCDKTASLIAMKSVDAVIGWSVFEHWNPEAIETIKLNSSELIRVGYIPLAISKNTKQKELAQQFIDFVMSEEALKIFKKHHYFTSSDEANAYIGEEKPVGGVYQLPSDWIIE
jgi:molybdate transport system substrate-binding protein